MLYSEKIFKTIPLLSDIDTSNIVITKSFFFWFVLSPPLIRYLHWGLAVSRVKCLGSQNRQVNFSDNVDTPLLCLHLHGIKSFWWLISRVLLGLYYVLIDTCHTNLNIDNLNWNNETMPMKDWILWYKGSIVIDWSLKMYIIIDFLTRLLSIIKICNKE